MLCRATRKIKAGEELSFSYASIPFGLKNREFRQKFIKDNMNMICICDFCKVETEDKDDIAAFEAFEKEEELLKMLIEESVGFKGPTVEDLNDFDKICQNTMDQIQCYKNIYNLGKKKHVCWNYLYEYVLLKGVEVPISTIRSAFSSKQILAFLKADGFHLLEEVIVIQQLLLNFLDSDNTLTTLLLCLDDLAKLARADLFHWLKVIYCESDLRGR